MEVDGFSLDAWYRLFEGIRVNPDRFAEAMQSQNARAFSNVNSRLIQYQIDLRKKVARKFLEPTNWVWSGNYLELCSDQITAEMVASYFPLDCRVIDIGCGGGSDALALARQNRTVTAIDKNEFAVRLTDCNSVLQLDRVQLLTSTTNADELQVDADSFVHLDPDRRSDGKRSVQLEWHSPGPETVKRLVNVSAGGSIKLAPACRDNYEELGKHISRQWISMNHHVVQQRWWWGIPEVASQDVWISAFTPSGGWIHESVNTNNLIGKPSYALSKIEIQPGMFIGDGDPALRASGFQGEYAAGNDCSLIGNSEGYFLSSQPLDTPLVRWQKIEAVLPLDAKRIKAALRSYSLDGIELKTRNTFGVSDEISKLSRLPGSSRGTLFAFRVGASHLAALCISGHR